MCVRRLKRASRPILPHIGRARATNGLYFDVGRVGSTILVAGSGRSGTTWVGDVVSNMTKSRLMFEPFVLSRNFELACVSGISNHDELDFNLELYASANFLLPSYLHQLTERILSGRVSSTWIDRAAKFGLYTARTIKATRANFLLEYVARTWPDIRVVWLIRNPYDVIDSQLSKRTLGWRFDWDYDQMSRQPRFAEEWLSRLDSDWVRATSRTVVGRLAHRWCIENTIPAAQGVVRYSNVLQVDYNSLVGSLEFWGTLGTHVSGQGWDMTRLQEIAARRSHTSRSGTERVGGIFGRWPYLVDSDIGTIEDIISTYEGVFNVRLESLKGGRMRPDRGGPVKLDSFPRPDM